MEHVLLGCNLSPQLAGYDYFASGACFYFMVVNPMIRIRLCVKEFKQLFLGKFCTEPDPAYSTFVSSCLEHGFCIPPSYQQFIRMCNSFGPCRTYWQFNGPKMEEKEDVPINFEDRLCLNWDRLGSDYGEDYESRQQKINKFSRTELLCCGLTFDGTDGLSHYFMCCNGNSVQRYGGDVVQEMAGEISLGTQFAKLLEQHLVFYKELLITEEQTTPDHVESIFMSDDNLRKLTEMIW